jgi:hypothetical protein
MKKRKVKFLYMLFFIYVTSAYGQDITLNLQSAVVDGDVLTIRFNISNSSSENLYYDANMFTILDMLLYSEETILLTLNSRYNQPLAIVGLTAGLHGILIPDMVLLEKGCNVFTFEYRTFRATGKSLILGLRIFTEDDKQDIPDISRIHDSPESFERITDERENYAQSIDDGIRGIMLRSNSIDIIIR